MKMSPLDIYNHDFGKQALGYKVREVDEFLDEVGMEYEKLMKEVNDIQDENERLQEKISTQEELEERLEHIMITVQETAKEINKQSRKEADLIIKKARMKANKIEEDIKEKLRVVYRLLNVVKENRELIKIRLKTLLNNHLELLENDEDLDINLEEELENIAASTD